MSGITASHDPANASKPNIMNRIAMASEQYALGKREYYRLKLDDAVAEGKRLGVNKNQIETAIEHGRNVAAGIDYPNWKD